MGNRKNKPEASLPVILEPGLTLMEALVTGNADIRADCGGKGLCGKCRVKVAAQGALSPVSPAEEAFLLPEDIQKGFRLACRVRLKPEHQEPEIIRVSCINGTGDTRHTTDTKTEVTASVTPAPRVCREIVSLSRSGPGLAERLDTAQHFSMEALGQIAGMGWQETQATIVRRGNKVSAVFSGVQKDSLGLAVDLGTTTVAAYLCSLSSGKILSAVSKANSQRNHGDDVISRIEFALKSPASLKDLQQAVLNDINELIAETLKRSGFSMKSVDDVCIVGNPSMQSILAGLSPAFIGRSPFLPVTTRPLDIPNRYIGLYLRSDVSLHLFPMPSAFIGGDAVAAALAAGQPGPGEKILVVDLGTNGELILVSGEGGYAASAATGPAFEGYTISCGSRAVPGAVSSVQCQPGQNGFQFKVIPGSHKKKASGLCGSALIDAVAAARSMGVIERGGRIISNSPWVAGTGPQRQLQLKGTTDDGFKVDLRLTQKDVRQLQLGKAALRAGIEILMETAGIDRVDKTVFTGAFGANFNWKSAMEIGMLPSLLLESNIKTVDNAAGQGAVNAVLNKEFQRRAFNFSRKLNCIKLEHYPDFSNRFALASGLSSEPLY